MAPPCLLVSLVAGLFFLSSPTLIGVNAARIHPRDVSTSDISNAGGISLLQDRDSDPKGTPFKGFDGCSDSKKNDIIRAWWDVVDLARIPESVNFDKPGTLETRFFGGDIQHRNDAKQQIHTVFKNIMDLYTSKTTGKIRIACKDIHQDHRADNKQTTCNNKVPGRKPLKIGGYAFSYGPEHDQGTIVLCPPFFAPGQESLPDKLKSLRNNKNEQKDGRLMTGKFKTLLHELTHLPSIEGQRDGKVVIIDQLFNPKMLIPDAAYGLYMVERLAFSEKQRARTHLNADTYAWYASEKYFEALFGTPDAYKEPRNDPPPAQNKPTKAVNIILEHSRHGVPTDKDFYDRMEWLLFSVPYGTGSRCKTDQNPVRAPADKKITQLIKADFPTAPFPSRRRTGTASTRTTGRGTRGPCGAAARHTAVGRTRI
ncbi:hypothetical protein PG987_009709 [Apiospora arundinis]